MGYQSRARNFSFMGVDALNRTFEVVPTKEEFPELIRPPSTETAVVQGTVALRLPAFAKALQRGSIRLHLSTDRS